MDELIQKKELFIESASSFFDRYSNATESLILDTLYTIIDALQGEGTIAKNAANRKKINEVNRVIFDALKQSKFSSEVRNFIKNFDTVEEFQKSILKEVNPDLTFDKLKFNDQKKELANEIIKGVTNKEMLENQIAKPLKKIMQEHVSKGITFKQAREEIRSYILKDENKRGLIGSRVNFLARESLLRFDGSINQKVATEFDMDAFRIVGSLIKTSEPSCREMIKGTGRFSGMMTNGKYAIKDIPVIIDKIRNDKAFVPGTNEKNYFTNRNHYGCRHTFIPTKFLKRDLEVMQREKVEGSQYLPQEYNKYVKDNDLNINPEIYKYLSEDFTFKTNSQNTAGYDFVNKILFMPEKRERLSNEFTMYHELGHVIDFGSNLRQNPEFIKIFNTAKKLYTNEQLAKIDNKLYDLGKAAATNKNEKRQLQLKQIGAVHDTMKALNIRYGMGHSDEYFKREGMPEAEFIAHMFSLKYMGNPYMKRYMPEVYKLMSEFEIPK